MRRKAIQDRAPWALERQEVASPLGEPAQWVAATLVTLYSILFTNTKFIDVLLDSN